MDPSAARLLLDGPQAGASGRVSAGRVRAWLGEVPVELQAILGHADFSLDELTSLQVGDVIALERRTHDPVEVRIDGRAFCRAHAGLAGQRVALEVIERSTEEARHES
jgi:flagellar motor switch protein FliM